MVNIMYKVPIYLIHHCRILTLLLLLHFRKQNKIMSCTFFYCNGLNQFKLIYLTH